MNDTNSPLYIYRKLKARHGETSWWPAEGAAEVMLGAVLTQNTAWANVEKAIANFGGRLEPLYILSLDDGTLLDLIRPAGFHSRKGPTLKALFRWFSTYDFDENIVKQEDFHNLRAELLNIKGIGPETADSILLYAFGFPTFVVDAYTKRLCQRYPLETGLSYDKIKAFFENGLEKSAHVFNELHALIVINGKTNCKKRPVCKGCALYESCQKLGI